MQAVLGAPQLQASIKAFSYDLEFVRLVKEAMVKYCAAR